MDLRNLTVGVVVSVALALFIGFTVWLTGERAREPTSHYSLFFEKDVSGLMLGGPVYYLGVEVGHVTRMEIIPGDPMSVRVDIEVLETTPVDTGTWASLVFQGVTGVAVINLDSDAGMNLPLKTPPGMDFPVIEVRDTGLAALLSDAPRITEKLNVLVSRANDLLKDENRALVAETLHELNALSGSLSARREAIAELPENAEKTLVELREGFREIRATVGELRPGLQSSVANLEQMSADLGALVGRMERLSEAGGEELESFMREGLGQVPQLVADARATLREVDKLVRALRENPSSLVYPEEEPGLVTDE